MMESIISRALQAAEFSYQQEFHDLDHTNPDWSNWYAKWLLSESEISDLLSPYFGIDQLSQLLLKLDGQNHIYYDTSHWSHLFANNIARYMQSS